MRSSIALTSGQYAPIYLTVPYPVDYPGQDAFLIFMSQMTYTIIKLVLVVFYDVVQLLVMIVKRYARCVTADGS
jgi:hypothetical protein